MKAVATAGKQTQVTAAVEGHAPVPGKATLTATEPAPRKENKDDRGTDLRLFGEFSEAYNNAVGAWGSIGDGMYQAIDSVYTEARKPALPDISKEIIVTLAVAGLGGIVGLLGSVIAVKVAEAATSLLGPELRAVKGVTPMFLHTLSDGSQRYLSESAAAAVRKPTEMVARYLGEFARSSFNEIVKPSAKSAIASLLAEGKHPMDAFFEGQKQAVRDSVKASREALTNQMTETYFTAADPLIAAKAVFQAMNAINADVMDITKDEVLLKWLKLQAQSTLKTHEPYGSSKMEAVPATGDGGGTAHARVNGVIFVDVCEKHGRFFATKGHLPGLTQAMLTRIQREKIWTLGLPIVYRVVNPGVGRPGYATSDDRQFNIRVDERHQLTVVGAEESPRHRDFLGRLSGSQPTKPGSPYDEWDQRAVIDGAHAIDTILRDKTLEELDVRPDHG